MKVTLNILAEDIKSSDYMSSYDCAITRALHRAGYPQLRDTGSGVKNEQNKYVSTDDNHLPLMKMVQAMYYRGQEPKDFSYELELDI